MNRAEMTECVAKAIALHEGYTQPDVDPEVVAWHNDCAAAVVAALLDQYGQTQWGVRYPSGEVYYRASSRTYLPGWANDSDEVVRVVSRRVLPSIETEWEPAT